MAEYIDKEEALKILHADLCLGCEAYTAIEILPAADVAPVVHAKWENNGADDVLVYCSNCCMPQDSQTKFYPSCGARMDGEAND